MNDPNDARTMDQWMYVFVNCECVGDACEFMWRNTTQNDITVFKW